MKKSHQGAIPRSPPQKQKTERCTLVLNVALLPHRILPSILVIWRVGEEPWNAQYNKIIHIVFL